ncbi:MAG: hypothetical protein GY873_13285 [Bosea sp.]|nr:hypothetical protein [Bosea sp. (in: a-proteobacteria)]MCP4735156.1 hypothetical protein [Bosea sp. (in: a-proteobacteria)]
MTVKGTGSTWTIGGARFHRHPYDEIEGRGAVKNTNGYVGSR